MSTQDDPHKGGSLSEMAVSGTTMPNDAGVQNLIPSVPRSDQISSTADDPNDLGARDLAGVADNPTDISRSTRDKAPTADVMTGTGDTLPAEVGSKNLHFAGNPDLSKGHQRYDKHVRQKGSDQERDAGEGIDEVEDDMENRGENRA